MIRMQENPFSALSNGTVENAITVKSLRQIKKEKEVPPMVNGDTGNSMEKDNFVSPVVQARLDSNGDIDGVNRFKYYDAPYAANSGRLVLPLRSSLMSAPLKPTTPVLEEWVEKKPLERSVRSGSSGYQSSTRSSSRLQAISERLYANKVRSTSCSRCSGDHGLIAQCTPKPMTNGVLESPPNTAASLPDIDSRDVRLLVSANSDRALGRRIDTATAPKSQGRSPSPSKRGATAPSSAMTILINIERKDDTIKELREKVAWRGEKLRQEIEEKLKHVQLRHERAMRILRDQQRQERQVGSAPPLSIDRPQLIGPIQPRSPRGFVRRSRYGKRSIQSLNGHAPPITQSNPPTTEEPETDPGGSSTVRSSVSDATLCSACNQPKSNFADRSAMSPMDVNLVDSVSQKVLFKLPTRLAFTMHSIVPLVENDIIKPLVDAVLRDSIDALCVFRANETLALGISDSKAIYDDVEQFLFNEVIPSAVEVAAFTSLSAK